MVKIPVCYQEERRMLISPQVFVGGHQVSKFRNKNGGMVLKIVKMKCLVQMDHVDL